MSILGDRIKESRQKCNKTQDEMADLLEITRGAYSSYETGKNIPPSDRLSVIADFLNVSADYLLGRTDLPFQTFELQEVEDGMSEEEREIMKQFLAESETILRSKANINDENAAKVLHYMRYTFLEDLAADKKSKK